MRQYTSAEMAELTGKAVRTVRKAAQVHEGIGRKIGRDWVFTDADIAKIKSIQMGAPTRGPGRPPGARNRKAVQP